MSAENRVTVDGREFFVVPVICECSHSAQSHAHVEPHACYGITGGTWCKCAAFVTPDSRQGFEVALYSAPAPRERMVDRGPPDPDVARCRECGQPKGQPHISSCHYAGSVVGILSTGLVLGADVPSSRPPELTRCATCDGQRWLGDGYRRPCTNCNPEGRP